VSFSSTTTEIYSVTKGFCFANAKKDEEEKATDKSEECEKVEVKVLWLKKKNRWLVKVIEFRHGKVCKSRHQCYCVLEKAGGERCVCETNKREKKRDNKISNNKRRKRNKKEGSGKCPCIHDPTPHPPQPSMRVKKRIGRREAQLAATTARALAKKSVVWTTANNDHACVPPPAPALPRSSLASAITSPNITARPYPAAAISDHRNALVP